MAGTGAAARVEGVVVALEPRGLYVVEIGGARRITAHPVPGRDRSFVRLVAGDRVVVELAARDRTRGRIVGRLQAAGSGRKESGPR